MMTFIKFILITENHEELIEFLCQRGVLLRSSTCLKCGKEIHLNKNRLLFRCSKLFKPPGSKKKSTKCNYTSSARRGTWFEKSILDLTTICRIVAFFLMTNYPRQAITLVETGVKSSATIVKWFSFCREVCMFWADKYSQKLGGPGHIVEIDEAKIGKRKYKSGRMLRGQWVFGGYERGSGKIFVAPVSDLTSETLLECIREWILPGTTIISYCWKAYADLKSTDFEHLKVNHSINFVDPGKETHPQHRKRVWREIRGNVARFGDRTHFSGHMCEFLFKRCFDYTDRIENFFKFIGELYPPKPLAESSTTT